MSHVLSFVIRNVVVCLLSIGISGCAGLEEVRMDVVCDCDASVHGEERMEGEATVYMTDETCVGLVEAIQGQWKGIGDMEDTRLLLDTDGSYTVWENRRMHWVRKTTGHYRVAYTLHHGMMFQELQLSSEEVENAILYRLRGEILHLMEATDGEPEMRFERLNEVME